MGLQKLQEIQGSTDLGIVGMVKRGKGKRSNDGNRPNHLTNDYKDQSDSAHILPNLELNGDVNQESCIGTRENMMERKDKYKKVNDLRLLEKSSDDIEGNRGSNVVAVELFKDSNHESDERRMEGDTKDKSSRHIRSQNITSSSNFLDEGLYYSENMAIGDGFRGSRKCKEVQKREKKKRKEKGSTDFNSLKNASVEEGANLEDEITHGGLMGSEKDQERQSKRKRKYKDNCKWDEDEEQDKKRKRKVHFLESVQDQGNSKRMAEEASEKAYMVIARSDAEEVPSRTHVTDKDQKRGKEKKYVANCPEVTLEMNSGKEKGVQRSTAATTNYDGKSKRNESYNSELKKDANKSERKVSFSKEVEEFPLDQFSHAKFGPDNFVWGKRFTPEEDELIRKAIMDYIEVNQLGEQGLYMILHCRSYKQVKDCWKVICTALPWRPRLNVLSRAHILFERSEERKWEPEELELIKRYHAKHGPKWRKLADILGKSRVHVKDAWRRIKLPNLKKGRWSQTEFQSLFDLVNLDLKMKVFQEKKSNHCVLKDNISWEAISIKLSTRGSHTCCDKWYNHLASSMVKEGNWINLDDYKLIDALQKADVCCLEDVDWDNLLTDRSGEICRKRWYEMIRHLDKFWAMSFVEQVDLLSERYCPDMIEFREMHQKKNQLS